MKKLRVFILGVLFIVSIHPLVAESLIFSYLNYYISFFRRCISAHRDCDHVEKTSEQRNNKKCELEQKALTHNNKVKQRFLQKIFDKTQPITRHEEKCIKKYLSMQEQEKELKKFLEKTYKEALHNTFEIDGDIDYSKSILLFIMSQEKENRAIEVSPTRYTELFNTFKTHAQYPLLSEIESPEDKHMDAHLRLCRQQLGNIGLDIQHAYIPSIQNSIYRLSVALDVLAKKHEGTQAYINAHTEVSEATFACIHEFNREDLKKKTAEKLIELGVDNRIMKQVGF